MSRRIPTILLALLVGAAACHKNQRVAADTTLNSDLGLAAQSANGQDTLSPADSALAANRAAALAPNASAASNGEVSRAPEHHVEHHETVRRSEGTITTTTTTSNGTVVKHTQRDAEIGAAAGAILGATTSRSKVKGGILGAAVGGLLGGVIGNNVDKTKKKP